MVEHLKSRVSVRLMSGELLLHQVWPYDLDLQVRKRPTEKGIPDPTQRRCNLHYAGEHQSCCQFFRRGQTDLVVVLSSLRYLVMFTDEADSLRDWHFAYIEKTAAELKFSYSLGCNSYSYSGEQLEHNVGGFPA